MGAIVIVLVAILMGLGIPMVVIGAKQMQSTSVIETPVAIAFELTEEEEWSQFNELARIEYEDEFTALFMSYETRWSKNNRLMIRQGNSGSYRFVAKA